MRSGSLVKASSLRTPTSPSKVTKIVTDDLLDLAAVLFDQIEGENSDGYGFVVLYDDSFVDFSEGSLSHEVFFAVFILSVFETFDHFRVSLVSTA
jgi:hypothetical protein